MLLFFLAILIVAIITRETTEPGPTVFVITFCTIVSVILLFWIGFSFSMRIQFDYEKKEVYIVHPYFLKRLKFEDVVSIEIRDYNEVAFDFIIKTKTVTKKMAYARFYRRRPSLKITRMLNDLKDDLRYISDKSTSWI